MVAEGGKMAQKLGIKTECDNEDEVKPITVARKKTTIIGEKMQEACYIHHNAQPDTSTEKYR